VVVAEEGSHATLIEEYTSVSPELSGYSNAVAELFVEQAAKLEYVSLQSFSTETWHFATHHASVGRDAELDWVAGGFGSKKGKTRIQNDLAGPGATSRVTGAYFADGDQHLDYDTFQEHIAPNTTSDFAFKGALNDSASTVWRGMIRVEKDAQKTNAYQENRNLMLSKKAHADSIPGLEILANDVRCTHGATLGQVDREQLFYLMARGLSRAEAERLIVRGFFQDILDRIELEPVRETLGEALEARIPQA
jgi:Fe-S cluster assembly protein SufD